MNSIAQPGPDRGRPDGARSDRAGSAGARSDRAGSDGAGSDGAGSGRASSARASSDRVRCRVAPSALALLESARQGLMSAENDPSAGGRYVGAHLSALRAAAAIVAARAEPAAPRRRRPQSVWEMLPRVEPTLSEWAAFFAAGAGKRAAAEAGLPRAVAGREADDLLRDATTFVSLAETALGVPSQGALPLSAAI